MSRTQNRSSERPARAVNGYPMVALGVALLAAAPALVLVLS